MDCHYEENLGGVCATIPVGIVSMLGNPRGALEVACSAPLRSLVTITYFCGETRISVAGLCANRTYYFEYCQPKPLINLSKFHNPFMQFLLHYGT